MPLSPGTRFGSYEVVAPLGAGGMGEVYRAHDASTGRDVALKILPELAAGDPERLARFQREAKALGGLNHPNIAAIYGVEDRGPVPAIVMELVEGEDLSLRINRGPIPLAETLAIVRQIADALSAAHDAGVVHRDLKPHNVKLRDDGVVKVLDFGLAKTLDAATSSGIATNSPTLTARATQLGMIIGTAAYMAPEQAKGKAVDKRADIWAFGVVLYEMLTGRRAFPGDDVSDVLASVLKSDPDLQALPGDTPPAVRRLLTRCLAKDPRERLRDLGEGMRQLEDADTVAVPVSRATAPTPLWRRAFPVAIAVVVTAGAAAAMQSAMAPPPPAPPSAVRFVVSSTSTASILSTALYNDVALLPDGSGVVYTTIGQSQPTLMIRKFDQFEATGLRGGVGAVGPFVSPDGQWVGFSDSTNPARLRKVSTSGGPPTTLALLTRGVLGAAFTQDGRSIVAGTASSGLYTIDSNGGEPVALTTLDPKTGENSHRWPARVPGTNIILFVAWGINKAELCALDLATKREVRLGIQGSNPRFLEPDRIVYVVRDGGLRATGFDPDRLELRDSPATVLEGLLAKASGAALFDLTSRGQLIYGLGAGMLASRSIVWVDRAGKETPTNAPDRSYYYARSSPTSGKLSLDVRDNDGDVWIWDPRGSMQRLTQTEGSDQYGLWMPTGDRVIFQSDMNQKPGLYVMRSDGLGTPALIVEAGGAFPNAVTPDGKFLIYRQASGTTKNDLLMVPIEGSDRTPKVLIQTPHDEVNAAISSDGKWIVFESDASGRSEVWVRPFPDVNAFQEMVSTTGGTEPVWAGGREIIFLGADAKLKSVTMTLGTGGKPTFTSPTDLFDTGKYFFGGVGRNYDVAPDGRRFVMVKSGAESVGSNEPLRVVLNWGEEVRRMVSK